jgi:hypothetical protein
MKDNAEFNGVDAWLTDNYIMLTEWLTNVVMIKEAEAKQTPSIFQTFITPIEMQPPHGLLHAGNIMKQALLLHAVFGVGVAPIPPPNQMPGMFPGFKQQIGRLPMEGDVVLFTATKWFQLGFQQGILHGSQGHSMIETVCTIDCLPKDAAIS